FEHLVAGADGGRTFIAEILSILLMLNVLLFVFNLIPLPPLDGASVLGLVLSDHAALALREFSRNPMFQLVGLLIAWRVFPYVVGPLFGLVLWAVHPGLGYS